MQEQGSSIFDFDDRAACQRSPMNGKGEEEAPTATTEMVLLELLLENPLVGEGISSDASARTRNAYSLRPAISSPSVSSFMSFPCCFVLA